MTGRMPKLAKMRGGNAQPGRAVPQPLPEQQTPLSLESPPRTLTPTQKAAIILATLILLNAAIYGTRTLLNG